MRKQSFGKSLKHVEIALPDTSSKKKMAVKKLAESMRIIAKTTKIGNTSTPHDMLTKFRDFTDEKILHG